MALLGFIQALSLALLTIVLVGAPPLRRLDETAETAREDFEKAIAASQGTLTALTRNLADDSAFTSHLRWQMNNSASTLANGQLRLGELDEVQVLSGNCQRLLRASLKPEHNFDCQQSKVFESTRDRFLWTNDQGVPVLAVVVGLRRMDKPTALVGFVRLDADWLALHPALATVFPKLKLKIAPAADVQKGVTIAQTSYNTKVTNGVTLVSDSRSLRWVPTILRKTDLQSTPITWILLAISMVMTISVWSRAQITFRSANDKFDEFLHWCRQVRTYAKDIALGKQPQPMPKPSLRGTLQTAQTEIITSVNELSDALLIQYRQIDSRESQIDSQRQQIQAAALDKSHNAKLKSLVLQTTGFAKMLQDDLGDFREKLQDLHDIAVHGLHPDAHKIASLLTEWQHQISQRGSRKFIRSLAETPITNDVTMLDHQLQQLSQAANHMLDAMLAMSQQKQHMEERLEHLCAVANFWSHFDANTDSAEPARSLTQAVEHAQRLVAMQLNELATVRFENHLESLNSTEPPPIPNTALISALFHLYTSAAHKLVAGPNAGTTLNLTTQLRLNREQNMLIVTAAIVGGGLSSHKAAASGDGESMHKHLNFARSIVAGYNLQALALPTVGQCFPFAITWVPTSVFVQPPSATSAPRLNTP